MCIHIYVYRYIDIYTHTCIDVTHTYIDITLLLLAQDEAALETDETKREDILYIDVYTYLCICMYIRTHTYINIYIYMFLCLYRTKQRLKRTKKERRDPTELLIYTYLSIYICIYLCIYIYIHTYMCVCDIHT